MDLVSPAVVDHHKRVAYIASGIAAEIGLPEKTQEDLIMAGILHDIGAISLKDRLDVLSFEADSTGSHAELGVSPYQDVCCFFRYSSAGALSSFAVGKRQRLEFQREKYRCSAMCFILQTVSLFL